MIRAPYYRMTDKYLQIQFFHVLFYHVTNVKRFDDKEVNKV
jgi:hypothetical protein